MKNKRWLSLIVVAVLLLSLAACQPAKPPTESEKVTPQATPTGTDKPVTPTGTDKPAETPEPTPSGPPPRKGITLTLGLRKNVHVEDYDTNAFTRWLEEQSGLDLDFMLFASDTAESATQLATMMSGNEKLPDLLLSIGNLTVAKTIELGKDGYFVDLKDYLDKSTHFKAGLAALTEAQQKKLMTIGADPVTGAIYAAPSFSSARDSIDAPFAMGRINDEWLKKLNLKKPSNPDELYDVLVAFRDKDPNGNGKADEIPALGSIALYRADIVSWLLNGFVHINNSHGYALNITDGKVWSPYVTDEFREGLRYVRKLVANNLLAEQTFVISKTDEYRGIICPADGSAVVGLVAMHPTLHVVKENERLFEYAPIMPFKYAPFAADTYSYPTIITADCQHPDEAFALIDLSYTLGCSIRSRFGEFGVNWDWAKPGEKDARGKDAVIRTMPENGAVWGAQTNQTWSAGSFPSLPKDRAGAFTNDNSLTARRVILMNQYLDEYIAYAATHSMKEIAVTTELVHTEEELTKKEKIAPDISKYIKKSIAEFCTGVLDLDRDWDAYLATLEGLGQKDWVAIMQAGYTRVMGGK
ncbi:MAG: hypothetical protein GX907_04645 [Clostridiaceae bacterium]|nr:hypothetical protein [Clostridiaceae bacterium]